MASQRPRETLGFPETLEGPLFIFGSLLALDVVLSFFRLLLARLTARFKSQQKAIQRLVTQILIKPLREVISKGLAAPIPLTYTYMPGLSNVPAPRVATRVVQRITDGHERGTSSLSGTSRLLFTLEGLLARSRVESTLTQ